MFHTLWCWVAVVFHFDDFNYGRRSQTYFFLTIATQLFFFIFIDVLQKLHSSQINLYCLSAEINQRKKNNAMVKRKRKNGQTLFYKALHRTFLHYSTKRYIELFYVALCRLVFVRKIG
jgi:hypothetical protein